MGMVKALEKMAASAAVGVAVITALPVFGAVGTITVTGIAVGSLLGAAAGLWDAKREK